MAITSPGDRAIGRAAINEAYASGVSWSAIIAGAVAAAALTLILVSLGSGFGFTMVSPWANEGASATAVGISAIVWLIATQLIASALGGYLRDQRLQNCPLFVCQFFSRLAKQKT